MTKRFIEAEPYRWPHDGRLSSSDTALLIIDMQRDFCDPGGYVSSMGYDLAPMRRIVPRIAAVRAAVSTFGGTVIYTREGHREDLSDLSDFKAWRSRRAGIGIGTQGPLGRLLVRGEAGWDIIPELEPAPGEIVVDKAGYSAFHGTDLGSILAFRGIRRLILTGVTTDVCVHSTLRDAVERAFECLLVSDACASTISLHHEGAVGTIATEGGIFGAVTDTASVVRSLASHDGHGSDHAPL